MHYTDLLIPTLRETPADAEIASHQLMLRAGYIRKVASGIYTYLPLCMRVIRKIEAIIRDEMTKSGAQELLLPMVMPSELWKETGRWDYYGNELLRFSDRHNRDFCLGPTHEESITDLFRHAIRSYRDLPKNCFQIQTKFRDEVRPRFGLMRGREFIMKDAYSFDRSKEDAHKSYYTMFETYKRIFTRCGVTFSPVEAVTGNIGGSLSHEFQVLAASGEDQILSCNACDYAANIEKAQIKPGLTMSSSDTEKGQYQSVNTPGFRTAKDVCDFLSIPTLQLVKTLILTTDQGHLAVLIRGDHEASITKLQAELDLSVCDLASDQCVEQLTSANIGFAGPIGLEIPVYADYSVSSMSDFVIGANQTDVHYQHVCLADFNVTAFLDLREACHGDKCPHCEDGLLESHRGIEVGQVFYLGDKYSAAMDVTYLDEKGQSHVVEMGCYGIGVSRTAAAAIEQNHDDKGICWPLAIAPFHVEIVPLADKGEVWDVASKLYDDLRAHHIDVLIDNRKERPGVKLADADLIGIPYRIVVGMRGIKDGVVEVCCRKNAQVMLHTPIDAISYICKQVQHVEEV